METKKETKKNKLLLPIIIGAAVLLLGGAGTVLALTGVFKQKPQETVTETEAEEDEVYKNGYFWNVDRTKYDGKSAIGTSSRVVNKDDGYYHILFATNGRQVTRRCADKRLVDQIDKNDVMGLVFDEKGIIVGVKTLRQITKGYDIEGLYFMQAKEDGTLDFNTSSSLTGRVRNLELPQGIRLFDVSQADPERYCGQEVSKAELTTFDRIFTLIDLDGQETVGYITSRKVSPVYYWNVERKYSSELLSTTREPNAEGEYEILMAANGEQVIVKTKNRALATAIDKVASKCVTLSFGEDGYVQKVTVAGNATGAGTFGSWAHITELNGQHIVATKIVSASDQGKVHDGTLSLTYRAFDVSGKGAFVGEEVFDLREYDQIHALRDYTGEVVCVFIVGRMSEDTVYWNLNRQYDSTKKETKRTPDKDGYYHFLMAHDGAQVELRTNDKNIANSVDSYAARNMGLKLDGDIILGTFSSNSTKGTGGGTAASWADVTKVSGNTFHTLKDPNSTDSKAGEELDLVFAEDAKIYNVSSNFNSFAGEVSKIQVNDRIHCLLNFQGEVAVCFIVDRPVNYPIYWNISRQYDSTKKETKRTPEADGYYHFQMAGNGKQVELRTKDKKIADMIDSSANRCIALNVSGDRIVKAYYATATLAGKGGVTASWADVTSVKSPTVFTTLKDPNSKDSKAGEKLTITIPAGCKVYNVSSVVEKNVGEVTTVQVGDTVHCFMNAKKQVTYIFVVSRKLKPQTKVCPVCGVETEFLPYDGSFKYDETKPTHFYFASDRTPNGAMGTTAAGEIHLDLNGHAINAKQDTRAFRMTNKSTVYIMDLSDAKTAKIVANGGQIGENGSLLSAPYTANKLVLMNLTIDGSSVNDPTGTGLIYTGTDAELVLDGCTVIAGSLKNGAAIYGKGLVTLKNTVITGGTSVEGGSVYMLDGKKLVLEGTTSVTGGKLSDGTNANIFMGSGALMDLTSFTGADASLGIKTAQSGVFTVDAMKDFASKFVSDISEGIISVGANDALQMAYTITAIAFDSDSIEIEAGTPVALTLNMTPANDSSAVVTYESSDTTVLTVDENGQVLGLRDSETAVTVTAHLGELSASILVTVKLPENPEHYHAEGTHAEIAGDTGVKMNYIAWESTDSLPTKSGYYFLKNDIHLNVKQPTIAAAQDIHICLNGHTIDNVYEGNAQTIVLFNEDASTLSICDCSETETGKIVASGSYNVPGRGIWARYGTLNLYGGTIVGAETNNGQGGGAVAVSKPATFNMYGGKLEGGVATADASVSGSGYGGTLSVHGVANITGGTITGGVATQGGTIWVTGTLNMSGDVVVSDGQAIDGRGGNMYVDTNAVVNAYGVTFEGGTSTGVGGNIYTKGTTTSFENCTFDGGTTTKATQAGGILSVAGGTVTLKNCTLANGHATNANGNAIHMNVSTGKLIIDGSTISDSVLIQGAQSVTLKGKVLIGAEGKNLTISNANASYLQTLTVDGMTSDSKVYVNPNKFETVLVKNGAAVIDSFVLGNSEYALKADGADLKTVKKLVGHAHCDCGGTLADGAALGGTVTHTDSEVVWNEWTSTTALPVYSDLTVGENYFYLTSDVTLTLNWRPGKNGSAYETDMAGRNIHICLNGHKIVASNTSTVLSTLGSNSVHTKNVNVTFTDCAATPGSITYDVDNHDNSTSAMMWLAGANAKLSIYNITLDGRNCQVKRNGGLISITSTGSELNLYSGTLENATIVQNGTTTYNGGLLTIAAGSTFNMYGGELSGGKATGDSQSMRGGNIALYGNANLYGGKIAGGVANQGGNIFVGNTGVLTLGKDLSIEDGTAANGRGGNLHVDTSGVVSGTGATIKGGTSTGSVGGSVYLKGASATFDGVTFDGGSTLSASQAGGIMSIAAGVVTLKDCTLKNGNATNKSGNAIHMNVATGELVIDGSVIENSMLIQGAKSVTLKGKVLIGAEGQNLTLSNSNTSYLQALTVDGMTSDSKVYLNSNKYETVLVKNGAQNIDNFVYANTLYELQAEGADLKTVKK